MRALSTFLILAIPSTVFAQTTVDYPDSVIRTPPQGQYPIFTPSSGNTVRGQIYCPSTFVSLPKTAMLVTKVGIQIAGNLPYTTFVGRAGTTSLKALGATFATNLVDQRIQFDLSGRNLPGAVRVRRQRRRSTSGSSSTSAIRLLGLQGKRWSSTSLRSP